MAGQASESEQGLGFVNELAPSKNRKLYIQIIIHDN
jgi:hypothetical protein